MGERDPRIVGPTFAGDQAPCTAGASRDLSGFGAVFYNSFMILLH